MPRTLSLIRLEMASDAQHVIERVTLSGGYETFEAAREELARLLAHIPSSSKGFNKEQGYWWFRQDGHLYRLLIE